MPMTRAASISAIIPARNSGGTLALCLTAIRTSTLPIAEIIVVSDGSTDDTCDVARTHNTALIDLPHRHHANHCRNLGAAQAHGDILMFLDSDVVLHPDATHHAVRALADPSYDAVVGVYSVAHRHRNAASQYKNLWIRYSYLRTQRQIDWIFGAIAVIRAEAFRSAGGFDDTLFMHAGGDLELGKRMACARPSILLNPSVEVEHLKRHTLITLLKNDFRRSQGFVRLASRLGQFGQSLTKGFVNIYPEFAYSSLIAWIVAALAIGSIWSTTALWAGIVALSCHLGINVPFFVYYASQRGFRHVPAAAGIMFLDHLVCGLGSLKGLFR